MDGRDIGRDCPPLPGRGRRGNGTAGSRQQRGGDCQVRGGWAPRHGRAHLYREAPKDLPEVPYHGRPGVVHHLAATATPGSINDVSVLVSMLAEIGRRRFGFAGRIFHADRWYDADYNYWMIFWMGMIPNITQQREPPTGPRPTGGGSQAVRLGRVSAEGADRGHLWRRGAQGASATLQGPPGRTTVCGSPRGGPSLERAGAQPVRMDQQTESSNPFLRQTTGTHGARLTLPACLWLGVQRGRVR